MYIYIYIHNIYGDRYLYTIYKERQIDRYIDTQIHRFLDINIYRCIDIYTNTHQSQSKILLNFV